MWDIFFLIAQLIVHHKVFVSIDEMFFALFMSIFVMCPAHGSTLY